jgi:GTP-binding protein EngB required for normal cell division
MLRFVLAGAKSTGKSTIISRFSRQASGPARSGATQTIPIPPAVFSVVTLEFPSPTISALTQRESIPQVLANAHAIIFCLKDPKDPNLAQFHRLLQNCDLSPRLFIILHKVDRIDKESQPAVLRDVHETAAAVGVAPDGCFATSMFDGSLTRAFSQIVANLLPNFAVLKRNVELLAGSFKAARVIVLDGATFLPICDSEPANPKQPQPIFDFFLRIYPRRNPLKTFVFECNSSVVVYTLISKAVGIFVSSTEQTLTTDAILFNVRRAIPTLKALLK